MNRSFVLAVAALLLVAAGSWWWAVRAVPSASSPVSDSDATDAEPFSTDEQAEPADAPFAAEAPPAVPAPAAALPAAPPPQVAAPPPVVAPVPEPPAPAAVPEPPSMAPQVGSLQRLKHAFEVDPVDPQAGAAESEISALFGSGENPRDTLLGVRCKQRACQLELRWSPQRPYSFMVAGTALKDRISEDMAVEPIGVPDNTGARRMYVYVARTGYLPHDFDPVPEAAAP